MRVIHKLNDKLIRLEQLNKVISYVTDGAPGTGIGDFDVEERDMIFDNLLREIKELKIEVHKDLKWIIKEEKNGTFDD